MKKWLINLFVALMFLQIPISCEAAQNVGKIVIVENGLYSIAPMHSPGRVLTVDAGGSNAECNIHLWSFQGVPHQKFYLEHRGSGYYTMKAQHSGLYVDAQGGVPHNGENVWQYTYNGRDSQLWRLIDAGNGSVYIETKMQPGLSFDCENRQGNDGTNIQLWQRGDVSWNKWKLTRMSENYNNMNDYRYKVVQITRQGQVVDTFKGVEAIYPLKKPAGGDMKWNCASLVKKYYAKNYGVTPYNLLPNKTPIVNGKQMKKVSNPQIGDVVGIRGGGKVNGHWAIVKEIEGNNVILFEQNWRNGNKAPVNRRVNRDQVNFYRL